MGTLFEDAARAHSAAVDLTYAERWLYQPFTSAAGDVNGRPSPDPDRPAVAIVGAFINPYARAFSMEARKQGVKPERPGHASARPQLDLDVAQLPYKPRQGDRVVRVKTGQVFHVAEPKFPSAGTRYQLDLNELDPGPAR
jgi:hypothetical protein